MISHSILCLSFTISLLILPIFAGPLRASEDEENANSATENDGPENDQIEGFAINAQFLCNGLPLIGAVQILDEVENCSQIVLHLDIPDRETTLDLLEPFDRWNATFQIACSQRASHFDAQKPPVLTVIHNCSPNETIESVQQEEQVCRKWDIPVPEENIGQNPKIVQLGTQELSEHGEEIDCPENVALMMRADEEEEEEADEAEIEAIEELEQMENAMESVVEPAQESDGGEEQEPEENEEEQQFDEGTTTQMPFGSNGEEQEAEE